MTATFSQKDQDRNAKLLVDMTAKGLGLSSRAFHSIPEIRDADGWQDKLKSAVEYVSGILRFPVELPAFDPDVCQTPTTDKMVLSLYNEFPDTESQILYPGGPGGTIWLRVSSDFPVGVMSAPFAVIGFTADGRAVLKQSYVTFLRQFAPKEE